MRRKRSILDDPYAGFPAYPHLPGVAKFRRIARSEITLAQKIAYSNAIRDAVLALQRKELQRELSEIRPSCASRTWATTGEEIEKRSSPNSGRPFLAAPDQIRCARTDRDLIEQYEQIMVAKRANDLTA
jgi:hypothetical protein